MPAIGFWGLKCMRATTKSSYKENTQKTVNYKNVKYEIALVTI